MAFPTPGQLNSKPICIMHVYVYRVISKQVAENINKPFLNKQGILILSVDKVLIENVFAAVWFP